MAGFISAGVIFVKSGRHQSSTVCNGASSPYSTSVVEDFHWGNPSNCEALVLLIVRFKLCTLMTDADVNLTKE